MIPRSEMVMVDVEDSYEEVREVFKESMYTRLPVYKGDRNNIIGLINVKDFLLIDDPAQFHAKDILRKVYYTYDSQASGELLRKMKQSASSNMAIVIDEYGMTVGMITMEDLLEELVGEIRDEYDEDEEKQIQKVGDREYLIDGSMRLNDINDELELQLVSEYYESIGGLIIDRLEHVPTEGEAVDLENGIHLEVTKMDKRHIKQVRMILPEQEAESESADDEKN